MRTKSKYLAMCTGFLMLIPLVSAHAETEAELIARLQAQITELTRQIQILVNQSRTSLPPASSSNTSTVSSIVPYTLLKVGDAVVTTDRVSLRALPAGTISGTIEAGTTGTIIGGPITATLDGTSYTWWNVRYGTRIGWNASRYMAKVGATPALIIPLALPAIPPTSSGAGSATSSTRSLTAQASIRFINSNTGQTIAGGLVVAAGSRIGVNVTFVGVTPAPTSCQWIVPINSIFQTQVYAGGLGASIGTAASSGSVVAKITCGNLSSTLAISAASTATIPGSNIWVGYVGLLSQNERTFVGTNENDCTNIWCIQYVQTMNDDNPNGYNNLCEQLIREGRYPNNVGGYGDCLVDASGHGEGSDTYQCEVQRNQCERFENVVVPQSIIDKCNEPVYQDLQYNPKTNTYYNPIVYRNPEEVEQCIWQAYPDSARAQECQEMFGDDLKGSCPAN
jgi:hypothetical protein